jgi:hypothetical protein
MAGTTGFYRPETSKLGLGFGVPGMALHLSGKVSSHVTFATNVTTDLCFSKKKKKTLLKPSLFAAASYAFMSDDKSF